MNERIKKLYLTLTNEEKNAFLHACMRYKTEVKPSDDDVQLHMMERIRLGRSPFEGLPECIGMD